MEIFNEMKICYKQRKPVKYKKIFFRILKTVNNEFK